MSLYKPSLGHEFVGATYNHDWNAIPIFIGMALLIALGFWWLYKN